MSAAIPPGIDAMTSEDTHADSPNSGTLARSAPYEPMAHIQRRLVLLVEDDPLVRNIASAVLEETGFQVLEAKDASEALQLMSAHEDVGVLFTDVNMPGSLDGLKLAEMIHARWPDIRLVITSGRALDRATPAGGVFLPKPYTPAEIERAVRCADGEF